MRLRHQFRFRVRVRVRVRMRMTWRRGCMVAKKNQNCIAALKSGESPMFAFIAVTLMSVRGEGVEG